MNERIRELYQQAHVTRSWDGDPMREGNPDVVYWQGDVSAQRFAELIVRECAELVNEEISLPYDSYSEKIKKHFGVEE